jgi:hypothetical protein
MTMAQILSINHHFFGSVGLLMLIALSGCISARPSQTITLGDIILMDTFDEAARWDTYNNGDIVFEVRGGLFRLDVPSGGYYLSLDQRPQTDIILEIDTLVLSTDKSNGYGLMCRADGAGDGYYFLLGSDGSATIRRGQGRQVQALMAWTKTGAVREAGRTNTLRAVCIGDYLALWVNGEFVGEVRDTLYSGGVTGIVGVTARMGERLTVDFDNLRGYAPLTPQ